MPDFTSHNSDRFARAVRELRHLVRSDDVAISRIMGAVRGARSGRRRRRAILMAAVLTAMAGSTAVWQFGRNASRPGSVSNRAAGSSFVQFVYVGSEAQEVSLVGSFNNWDPRANPLHREGTVGVWFAEVSLPPGHHEYAFNVDGRWVPDDDAPLGASDEFGVANSVILVQ